MRFVGDIHGKLHLLPKDGLPFTQIGDLGVGFVRVPEIQGMRFCRGNHDDPALCQLHPNFIGDWKVEDRILYLSGAGSIDKAWRQEGIDWWRDEELSFTQQTAVLELECDIEIVVAHDVPVSVYPKVGIEKDRARFNTPVFLEEVLKKFRPRIWVAGHHHVTAKFHNPFGTVFYILNEGEVREIDL